MNLFEKKELIDMKPMHIATINENNTPNLSIASDVKVLDENKIIISHNEMINTPNNIMRNKNVVLTSFDENWEGFRLTGIADYYTSGEYYDFCNNTFFANGEVSSLGINKSKGAIVISVEKIEEIK